MTRAVIFHTDGASEPSDDPHMSETQWLMVGLMGQALFSVRFLLQWISSEKVGRSVIPVTFWYFSTAGGMVLLLYALRVQDPVFILGQSSGLVVYLRNLWLIHKLRDSDAESLTQP